MTTENLPGIFTDKQDGGLSVLATSSAPKILVIGTAGDGISEDVYVVGRTQDAAVEFGSTGTLIRGMYAKHIHHCRAADRENAIPEKRCRGDSLRP